MSENNIYDTPKSELVDQSTSGDTLTLASRWARLGAAIIDGIIVALVTIPAMYFTGGFNGITSGRQPGILYLLGITVLGMAVYFAINYRSLIANGQTIGKKMLDIKIVDLNGDIPKLQWQLIIRYAVTVFPSQIPVVGPFYGLIDALFILSKEKRCIHDLIAKTRVVKS